MTTTTVKTLLAATVFVGAMLLFMVQPMVAKAILPWLGGSAGVWTTAVLLFQTLLLAGYLYAHLSAAGLLAKLQPWLHLALLAAALLALPVVPPESLKATAAASPIGSAMLAILLGAGLPFFVLSSTSTLAQAWWHRLDPISPPYRLYALSNAGSLIGLLAYPVVVEPLIGVRQQAYAWSIAMCFYALLSGACAWLGARRGEELVETPVQRVRPGKVHLMAWLLWPAASSLLLLALTASMSQRVAPIPFIWILPLSLYLLSFILCFERPAWYSRALFVPLYMVLLLLDATLMLLAIRLSIWQQLSLTSALLFAGCMICHGELYRTRPAAAGLSLFYLLIAMGSVAGSVLAAVVAPLVFEARWELHIAFAAIAGLMVLVLWGARDSALKNGKPAIAWFGIGIWLGTTGLVLWLDAAGIYGMTKLVARERSFYGEITVRDVYWKDMDASVRSLYHDGVVHGLQVVGRGDPEPLSYYWRDSGLGRLMAATESGKPRKIGVVGLGAGAIASWGRDRDRMVFYELDPLMIKVAKEHFTYLSDAHWEVEIIPGDARITLQQQPDQAYDLLILDAFSGNALPVHLLTIEAIGTYSRHLKPDGVLAIHISNHYLDLEPVIARIAQVTGLHARILSTPAGEFPDLRHETDVALLSREPAIFEHELIRSVAREARGNPRVGLWTDDYSNLLRTVK